MNHGQMQKIFANIYACSFLIKSLKIYSQKQQKEFVLSNVCL